MNHIPALTRALLALALILHRCRLFRKFVVSGCLAALGSSFLLAQGPLAPPGAPAPLMKTLTQVEPRTDLQATPAPPGVDTSSPSYHYIINQPGSYYLSANLGVTKASGIFINAAGVTLDLNGFELRADGGGTGAGIQIAGTAHGASVSRGSIRGFGYGVRSIFATSYPRGCAMRDLAISGCTAYGILAGDGARIEGCRVSENSGEAGISSAVASVVTGCTFSSNTVDSALAVATGSTVSHCAFYNNSGNTTLLASPGCTVSHCSAYSNATLTVFFASNGSTLTGCTAALNTAAYGFAVSAGSTLNECVARQNTGAAAFSTGFNVGDHCTVTACTAVGNTNTFATPGGQTGAGIIAGSNVTIKGCTAGGNKGDGIYMLDGCHVIECTVSNNLYHGIETRYGGAIRQCVARQNQRDGIFANAGCLIIDNTCDANGNAGDGAGIHTLNDLNRIEGNMVIGNDRGVDVDAANNLIIRNTARTNSPNYVIVANNKVGTIVSAPNSAAINGATGGAGVGSTDSWANLSY